MSRNNKAPPVDTPNYNSVILKVYKGESSFIDERGSTDLDRTLSTQNQKRRLAVKLSQPHLRNKRND